MRQDRTFVTPIDLRLSTRNDLEPPMRPSQLIRADPAICGRASDK
jgi:hypothetical protein